VKEELIDIQLMRMNYIAQCTAVRDGADSEDVSYVEVGHKEPSSWVTNKFTHIHKFHMQTLDFTY